MPDGACEQMDVRTEHGRTSYPTRADQTVEVTDPRHIRMMRAQGAFPANLGGTPRTDGYPCACGHQSFFRVCGKCGADNPRTEE
jgi:hypothetical protein